MSGSRSSFFAAQNVQDSENITLPRLGPINKRQAPVHLSRDGWTIIHDSASVPPETALPRGAREQNNNATTAQIRLPPASALIAEVDAYIAGQLECAVRILTPQFPKLSRSIASTRVVINCQSLVSRNVPGLPLYDMGNWTRPAINLYGTTEFEVERCLASVHPPLIGFYLAGYSHLNLAVSLSKHHKCRNVHDLVLHAGAICQRFVRKYCNDYQGPEGIRVGPGHAPLECVRMIRVVQMSENYWIGVLIVNLPQITRP